MIHENMFEILTVICWFERLISGTDEQMNFHIKLIFFVCYLCNWRQDFKLFIFIVAGIETLASGMKLPFLLLG